jgi:hypothetical protein
LTADDRRNLLGIVPERGSRDPGLGVAELLFELGRGSLEAMGLPEPATLFRIELISAF